MSTTENSPLIHIDEQQLDLELIKFPELFHDHAMRLAESKSRLADLKAEMEYVKAELDKNIRKNPEKYGITKISEKVVETTIILQPGFQKIQRRVNKRKYLVDAAQARVDTLEVKKKGIEGLITLHGQDYFSTPRVPKHLREKWDEMMKQSVRSRGRKQSNGGH